MLLELLTIIKLPKSVMCFLKKHWNKGYTTEAYKAVIDELFCNGFTKITAAHRIDNPASGRVMEKCGMSYVGYDKTIAKWGSDELCDVRFYELIK